MPDVRNFELVSVEYVIREFGVETAWSELGELWYIIINEAQLLGLYVILDALGFQNDKCIERRSLDIVCRCAIGNSHFVIVFVFARIPMLYMIAISFILRALFHVSDT